MNEQVAEQPNDGLEEKSELDVALDAAAPELRQALVTRMTVSDLLLADMVDLAETAVGLPITLLVSGQLITGHLASSGQYFDRVNVAMANSSDPTIAAALQKFFDSKRPNPGTDTHMPGLPPKHVYLIDARYLSGGQWIPSLSSEPITWRGLIAAVDGFSLGLFSAGK